MNGAPDTPSELVLVVDVDTELAEYLAGQLRDSGFETSVARDGYQALAQIARRRPDLVLMEVALPLIDGLELTRQLRGDPMTASLPLIMVTSKGLSADRIAGLTAGADDYIVKPYDAAEVVARVRSALRRHREIREISPLTGLPGNARILGEIAEWVRGGEPFALCYVDMNQFKSVNDAYGFVRGDEFLQSLASSLHRAALAAGPPQAFIGHVGGDDFIIMCDPLLVAPITRHAIAEFETRAAALCDPVDAERGYIESKDRQGNKIQARLPTLSIGVALSNQRQFADPREVVAVATEMKSVAKSHPGSHVAYDRRNEIQNADFSELANLAWAPNKPHHAAWQPKAA
ncbi:response regulator [Stackebrandtia soli]|uniref:response regulator n=1 Tax=Stackebrandtia soli TaxID=1892856 RepID=UPI0039E9211B